VNPHELLLPSAADLVRAFVKDLANVFDLQVGEAAPTIQRTLWCASGTATLTADRDYAILGVTSLAGGAFCLAAAPTTVAALGLANNASFDVIAANTSASFNVPFLGLRWIWKFGTKLFLVSTVGVGVMLTLEPLPRG